MSKYPTQKDPDYGTRQYCPPFTPMIDVLALGSEGKFTLDTVQLDAELAHLINLKGMYHRFDEKAAPGKYVRLLEGNLVWMSDAPRERYTNLEFIRRAHGHVLVAGLGIGMVIPPLLAKDGVKNITVIEREPDVIKLVGSQVGSLRGKGTKYARILQGDIHDWRPPRGMRFNTIWLDIWPDVCADNWDEMVELQRVFAHYLDRSDPERWCATWEHDYIKYLVRRDKGE